MEHNKYRYIINRRSGKVHTYNHGMEIIENSDNVLKTNESIEEILQNEKYDICLTCYAGLDLNLKKYKKKTSDSKINKLIDEEITLIEKYMRLYEFGQLDTETQKFLLCIFEVGSWYVNNVYTQLGGQKTVLEINTVAADYASENAYRRWQNYLNTKYYNKYELRTDKRILPVIYDNDESTDMVLYRCDLFKDAEYGKGDNIYSTTGMQTLKNAEGEEIFKEWKNYCVVDDSSKFAAAVYYHYLNKEILKSRKQEDRVAYGIDLWWTSSTMFTSKSSLVSKLTKTKQFSFYNLNKNTKKYITDNENNIIKDIDLQVGDLICRNGNVVFYIGNDKTVGWGSVTKEYITHRFFKKDVNGYFYDINNDNLPYTAIVRFRRE